MIECKKIKFEELPLHENFLVFDSKSESGSEIYEAFLDKDGDAVHETGSLELLFERDPKKTTWESNGFNHWMERI